MKKGHHAHRRRLSKHPAWPHTPIAGGSESCYGALTGNDCESERAAQTLREYPLDMRSHGYRNSHRADLAPRPGFVRHKSGRRGLSPRQMAAERGGRPASAHDGGAGGRAVVEPVCWASLAQPPLGTS